MGLPRAGTTRPVPEHPAASLTLFRLPRCFRWLGRHRRSRGAVADRVIRLPKPWHLPRRQHWSVLQAGPISQPEILGLLEVLDPPAEVPQDGLLALAHR